MTAINFLLGDFLWLRSRRERGRINRVYCHLSYRIGAGWRFTLSRDLHNGQQQKSNTLR
jgi:hypothetical protein